MQTSPQIDLAGAGDFDFLFGRWRVEHRKLRERLAQNDDWIVFPGTLDVRPVLGGAGNIDDNRVDDPAGPYRATTLRLFDADSGLWGIRWIDARLPGIDAPLFGRFDGRLGRFEHDEHIDGRTVRVRFTYEDLGPGHARWAQAFSPNQGLTWETNWIMAFTRDEATR